jgi:hypothetical protein
MTRYPAKRLTASAVCPSAGKNISIASSASVTSTGVPKTVVVLMKERSPSGVRMRSGTSTACSGAWMPRLRRGVGGDFFQ